MMLLLINLLLLAPACVMEGIPIKLIRLPILLPMIDALGTGRLHFGVVMTYNLLIGMATPPVGLGLFGLCSITDLKVDEIVRAIVPFFVPLLAVLALITSVPALSLWLPNPLMPQMR